MSGFGLLPLSVTIEPATVGEWIMALRRAPVGTVVSDKDGDIWTKMFSTASDGLTWLRTNGGWSRPEDMVEYAPFFVRPEDGAP